MNTKVDAQQKPFVCAWCYPFGSDQLTRNKNCRLSHGICDWHARWNKRLMEVTLKKFNAENR